MILKLAIHTKYAILFSLENPTFEPETNYFLQLLKGLGEESMDRTLYSIKAKYVGTGRSDIIRKATSK